MFRNRAREYGRRGVLGDYLPASPDRDWRPCSRRRFLGIWPELDAVRDERLFQIVDVLLVVGFDVADDADATDIGAGIDAVVRNLLDARPGFRDQGGEMGEAAGTIADRGDKAGEAAIGGQANFDHAA